MENSVSLLSPPTSSLGSFAIPQALETKIVQEIDHLIRAVQAINRGACRCQMVDCALRKRPHRCPFGSARILEHAVNGMPRFGGLKVSGSRPPEDHRDDAVATETRRGPATAQKRRGFTHRYILGQTCFKMCEIT